MPPISVWLCLGEYYHHMMSKYSSDSDQTIYGERFIKAFDNSLQLPIVTIGWKQSCNICRGRSSWNSPSNTWKDLLASDDSHVDADTPYAEVEVMKMCMPLLSLASGIIHFKMSEGQAMQAGELIARLHLDDPSAIRKAEPFTGSFPVLGHPTAISGKVHHKCVASLNVARMILSGYDHNIDEADVIVDILKIY
ncbi:hypothetical protein JHK84_027936 [Glycine max]|nr:hypothetical protein JHK86_027822 [Glycine max]KAG5151464.1 hypothetical protein JHK84_027936 [Glycine max]